MCANARPRRRRHRTGGETMSNAAYVRHFIAITPSDELRQAYFSRQRDQRAARLGVEKILRRILDKTVGDDFRVIDLPLNRVRTRLRPTPDPRPDPHPYPPGRRDQATPGLRLDDDPIIQKHPAIRLGIVVEVANDRQAIRRTRSCVRRFRNGSTAASTCQSPPRITGAPPRQASLCSATEPPRRNGSGPVRSG